MVEHGFERNVDSLLVFNIATFFVVCINGGKFYRSRCLQNTGKYWNTLFL